MKRKSELKIKLSANTCYQDGSDDENSKGTNFCLAEIKSNTPEAHNAQFDPSRHQKYKLRKLDVHDRQRGCQRAPDSASSEEFLNESFCVKSEPYDDLSGDDGNPVVGFKKTCEGMHLRVCSREIILIRMSRSQETSLVDRH